MTDHDSSGGRGSDLAPGLRGAARRLASGRATASCGPGWPGAGFSRCGLSGHVLWLRRSEHLAGRRARAARDQPGGAGGTPGRAPWPQGGLGPLGDADATEIAISVAVATVNSAAEELLWRGVFLARFPRSLIAGAFCPNPSVLFGLSHLGPLSVRPSKRGAAAFVAAAAALGYVYGLESTLQPVAPRHDHSPSADRCSRRIADRRIPRPAARRDKGLVATGLPEAGASRTQVHAARYRGAESVWRSNRPAASRASRNTPAHAPWPWSRTG